ncbi:MAG: DM13 domain-containing protein [Desmonostoc vinosum HA7617-LM4]|jgi:hypothetical protein|nr:DM13 domain-containing protein [Desmonostoc vinosum HA7617-LM4]
MKLQHLAMIAIISIATIGCTTEVKSNSVETPGESTTPVETPVATPAAKPGNFKNGEHPTTGTVSIVTEQGKRYLEFSESFKTDNGPDLFVILHRSDTPPIYGIKEKDYVSVAPLQKISGTQRYAIPDNVKVTDFRSVAVWCRKFNATFGYAPLSGK